MVQVGFKIVIFLPKRQNCREQTINHNSLEMYVLLRLGDRK